MICIHPVYFKYHTVHQTRTCFHHGLRINFCLKCSACCSTFVSNLNQSSSGIISIKHLIKIFISDRDKNELFELQYWEFRVRHKGLVSAANHTHLLSNQSYQHMKNHIAKNTLLGWHFPKNTNLCEISK